MRVVLMLDSISINMSFIPLSTCINSLGETERRFLTPFGIIDVVYRASKQDRRLRSQFEREMFADTDTQIVFSQTSGEFQTAFQELWWKTAQRLLAENIAGNLKCDVPATQARPLAESSKLKAESGLDEPLSFELRASILSMP